jgi:hypothetical protein
MEHPPNNKVSLRSTPLKINPIKKENGNLAPGIFLTESRINLFEGLDILNDGFNWSCGQVLQFLTESGIWAQLDYLAV